MEHLASREIAGLLLSLSVLLGAAHITGECVKRLHQPAVLGEILAGVFMGPTILGYFSPQIYTALFPSHGNVSVLLSGFATLSITLYLLVAGMEVSLSTMWRQGRLAMSVSLWGMFFPFGIGFAASWFLPELLGGSSSNRLVFSLFFATALSISALPVIAKTLMDLKFYRTDFGMVVMAAAVFNDFLGWIVFAVILGMMRASPEGMAVGQTIFLTITFVAVIFSLGRGLIHKALLWMNAYTNWSGSVISFALTMALLCAAFTEWIGIHAIFGAFLLGVALGDSSHLREQTRETLDRFISFFFAPLFFVTIGLRVNFLNHFDWVITLCVFLIACFGKIIGCGIGARFGGLSWRESWAVGFAMNARGAMEIILGLLALNEGLIGEEMFVALVIMALGTSALSGPFLQRLLRPGNKSKELTSHFSNRTFVKYAKARDRWEAIEKLAKVAAEECGLGCDVISKAVISREKIMGTGLPNGVAVPHARIEGLKKPYIVVGFFPAGVDFDSPNGEPAQLVFLILTPPEETQGQLDMLSEISHVFSHESAIDECLQVNDHTEFLAWFKYQSQESAKHT